MRSDLLLAALLALALVPGARADAREVHLSLAPSGYVVTFESAQPLGDASVAYEGPHPGRAAATPVQTPAGDSDVVYEAQLPADATNYTVDGRSFPIRHAPADTLRVVVMADMGRSSDSWKLWALAEQQSPDVILVAGDVSYANGDQQKWDDWFTHAESLAATVPVMTAMGNHETYCSPDGVDLKPCAKETLEYVEHFQMPDDGKLYYDFDLGPAHFVSLDTEAYHPGEPKAPTASKDAQNAFLAKSLKDAGGRWKIVFFHRPLYSSNAHEQDVSDPAAKADWLPILDANGASLVLNGHAHAYERSYAMRGDAVASRSNRIADGTGIFYVTTGGGGRSLYSEFTARPAWSATRSAEFELVVLDVTKDAIQGRALRPDGSQLDAFAITRGASSGLAESGTPAGRAVPALAPLGIVAALLAASLASRRASRQR